MRLHRNGKAQRKANIFFRKQAQSSLRQSLSSIGKSLLKNILSYPLRTHLTKRTGKAGSSLQRNSATKFSLSEMTSLLLTQSDLQRVLNLAAATQFLSNSTRLVLFLKLLRQSRWLTKQVTLQLLRTVRARPQTQQLLTLQLH